jgi:hypothetical protein
MRAITHLRTGQGPADRVPNLDEEIESVLRNVL